MDQISDPQEHSNASDLNDQHNIATKNIKTPYKSFKKKYRKMEIQFAKVMAKSEELFRQDSLSKKTFDRLLREKS